MGFHSYAREELVAELGAVLLGGSLEIGALRWKANARPYRPTDRDAQG